MQLVEVLREAHFLDVQRLALEAPEYSSLAVPLGADSAVFLPSRSRPGKFFWSFFRGLLRPEAYDARNMEQ